MNIKVIGAGPAGSYFALLMKLRDPSHQIEVYERDGPDDTFGWGIVFSDQALSFLHADEPSAAQVHAACQTWDNVEVVHRGTRVSIHGNRFSGIARIRFLQILRRRSAELGVVFRYREPVDDPRALAGGCDLLVGADGANSTVRRAFAAGLEPTVGVARNRYIWLGTERLFHGLTLTFREEAAGLFIAHSYKFSDVHSTFIVECSESTWRAAGLDRATEDETCRYLERVFRDDLAGRPLLTGNFVRWLNFVLVRNARWHAANLVLLGDALHTAHFSIGSGTRLAIEDAIALAECFARGGSRSLDDVLSDFEATRRPQVEAYQAAAGESLAWFENAESHLHLDPIAFAYRLMTRSGRIDHEKLRQRDPEFVAAYEAHRRSR